MFSHRSLLCACACYVDTLALVVFFFVIVSQGCALAIQIISEIKHSQIISEPKNWDRQAGGQAGRQTDRQTGTGKYRDAPHLRI